jgi:hypothetical protein
MNDCPIISPLNENSFISFGTFTFTIVSKHRTDKRNLTKTVDLDSPKVLRKFFYYSSLLEMVIDLIIDNSKNNCPKHFEIDIQKLGILGKLKKILLNRRKATQVDLPEYIEIVKNADGSTDFQMNTHKVNKNGKPIFQRDNSFCVPKAEEKRIFNLHMMNKRFSSLEEITIYLEKEWSNASN